MAGADLSIGTTSPAATEDGHVETIVADEALMPEAFFYNPNQFDTMPIDVLAGSAINGFDKGIEAIYSRFGNPLTNATAVQELQYLKSSLPSIRESWDAENMVRAVLEIILVQYDISVPRSSKMRSSKR